MAWLLFCQLLNCNPWTGWLSTLRCCINGVCDRVISCLQRLIPFLPSCECRHQFKCLFCTLWWNCDRFLWLERFYCPSYPSLSSSPKARNIRNCREFKLKCSPLCSFCFTEFILREPHNSSNELKWRHQDTGESRESIIFKGDVWWSKNVLRIKIHLLYICERSLVKKHESLTHLSPKADWGWFLRVVRTSTLRPTDATCPTVKLTYWFFAFWDVKIGE